MGPIAHRQIGPGHSHYPSPSLTSCPLPSPRRTRGDHVNIAPTSDHRGPAPPASSPAVAAVMRGNRRRDTLPELRLRSELYQRGFRYRVNLGISLSTLVVKPDIVFLSRRLAVFVDGCFWHSCPMHGHDPHANQQYWLPKLKRVVDRDRRVEEALRSAGWRCIRVWEHTPALEAALIVQAALTGEP